MRQIFRSLHRRYKKKRFIDERTRKFADADIVVVSYTKSGRTWLRALLSNLYSRLYALPSDRLIDGDNLHSLHASVPRIFFCSDTKFPFEDLGPPKVTLGRHQRALFVIRDPRDVAVSFFHHVQHRASEAELKRKKIPLKLRQSEIDDFVLSPLAGVPRVIRYLNRWAREREELARWMAVRYEDLKADTVRQLADIADFAGTPADESLYADVVGFCSFDNLADKERSGFFQSGRFGLTNATDVNSAKVRRGEIGSYRSELSAATVTAVDAMVATELDPRYGYR